MIPQEQNRQKTVDIDLDSVLLIEEVNPCSEPSVN